MTSLAGLVLLGDVDLLLRELEAPGSRQRLRKLGFVLDGVPKLIAARDRLARAIDHRWMVGYERARQRYGRGIAAVRELSRRQGRQLSEVVNELLAEGLQRRRARRVRTFELPSFAMGRQRVNLGDRNALEALMDS